MGANRRIQQDVMAQLLADPSIDAAGIGVVACDNVITLTGHVGSDTEKLKAEKIAQGVYGVQGVANDLEVKLPGSSQRSDSEIAQAALHALKWDVELPLDSINVAVSNGSVLLDGQVDWEYQRSAAERDVRSLYGVNGVTNQITVRRIATPDDVKGQIEASFRRSAELDARRIQVQSSGGKVTLTGHVRSWSEREAAQHAAWSTLGVTEVDNQLRVVP